jgi:hypothetical protein
MKRKLLCLALALLMLLPMLIACAKSNIAETGEHYLPEELFAKVKAAFEEKDASFFPGLTTPMRPFRSRTMRLRARSCTLLACLCTEREKWMKRGC